MINIQKEVIKMQKDKELTKKEMFEIFNRRYACKKYDKTKVVSDEDFMAIIEAGRLSPSSFGLEPWKFILVKNEEMLNDMREFAWGAINSLNGASHIVMVLARKGVTGDSEYFEKIGKEIKNISEENLKIRKEFFTKFQKEHFKLLESERALFDWASKQTYIAMVNMMNMAAALGIDSCAIEGFNKEMAEKYFSEKGVFDLKEYGISYFVSFGYRDEDITPKTRREPSEVYEVVE